MSDPANPARRGGRGERRASRMKPNHEMLPHLTRQLPLTEPMDAEQIEQIDDASLSILEEVGVVFRDDIALEDCTIAVHKSHFFAMLYIFFPSSNIHVAIKIILNTFTRT